MAEEKSDLNNIEDLNEAELDQVTGGRGGAPSNVSAIGTIKGYIGETEKNYIGETEKNYIGETEKNLIR